MADDQIRMAAEGVTDDALRDVKADQNPLTTISGLPHWMPTLSSSHAVVRGAHSSSTCAMSRTCMLTYPSDEKRIHRGAGIQRAVFFYQQLSVGIRCPFHWFQ